jgi:DNA-binding MarR family transcriptional regulator
VVNGVTPVSTLLSQVLIAFTIELDNEFELRVPHGTTKFGVGGPEPWRTASGQRVPRVWLVSWGMWANYMQHIDDEGVPLGRFPGSLDGLRRWGFVTIEERGARAPRDRVVRATTAGRLAMEVWRELPAALEPRWSERFGSATIEQLRGALGAVVGRLDVELPDYLPVLGYGLGIDVENVRRLPRSDHAVSAASLVRLVSKVLLALTVSFERRSKVSLAISADVLRLTADDGVGLAALPRRSGVSPEAIAMAAGFLERHGYAVLGTDPADGRSRHLALTVVGREARDERPTLLDDAERRLGERVGTKQLDNLRRSLETLTSSTSWSVPKPPAGTWRARTGTPAVLAHQPMVLHRGGYPDGS